MRCVPCFPIHTIELSFYIVICDIINSSKWIELNRAFCAPRLSHSPVSVHFFPGRAYLFKRVVNLTFSQVQDRIMLTGRHMVRDVMCKNCKTKLGWMYEFATEDTQKYVSYYYWIFLPILFYFVSHIDTRRVVSFWSMLLSPNRKDSPRIRHATIITSMNINHIDGMLRKWRTRWSNNFKLRLAWKHFFLPIAVYFNQNFICVYIYVYMS